MATATLHSNQMIKSPSWPDADTCRLKMLESIGLITDAVKAVIYADKA